MRLVWVVVMMGCGGGSSINPDSAFGTDLPAGFPDCIDVGPALVRLDAETPTGTAVITGTCGYNQAISVVVDDPSDVFEVDPMSGMAGIDDVVITVSLAEAEPGEYDAQLGVKIDEFTSWIELRGIVSAE